jgi:hypothetical protein
MCLFEQWFFMESLWQYFKLYEFNEDLPVHGHLEHRGEMRLRERRTCNGRMRLATQQVCVMRKWLLAKWGKRLR